MISKIRNLLCIFIITAPLLCYGSEAENPCVKKTELTIENTDQIQNLRNNVDPECSNEKSTEGFCNCTGQKRKNGFIDSNVSEDNVKKYLDKLRQAQANQILSELWMLSQEIVSGFDSFYIERNTTSCSLDNLTANTPSSCAIDQKVKNLFTHNSAINSVDDLKKNFQKHVHNLLIGGEKNQCLNNNGIAATVMYDTIQAIPDVSEMLLVTSDEIKKMIKAGKTPLQALMELSESEEFGFEASMILDSITSLPELRALFVMEGNPEAIGKEFEKKKNELVSLARSISENEGDKGLLLAAEYFRNEKIAGLPNLEKKCQRIFSNFRTLLCGDVEDDPQNLSNLENFRAIASGTADASEKSQYSILFCSNLNDKKANEVDPFNYFTQGELLRDDTALMEEYIQNIEKHDKEAALNCEKAKEKLGPIANFLAQPIRPEGKEAFSMTEIFFGSTTSDQQQNLAQELGFSGQGGLSDTPQSFSNGPVQTKLANSGNGEIPESEAAQTAMKSQAQLLRPGPQPSATIAAGMPPRTHHLENQVAVQRQIIDTRLGSLESRLQSATTKTSKPIKDFPMFNTEDSRAEKLRKMDQLKSLITSLENGELSDEGRRIISSTQSELADIRSDYQRLEDRFVRSGKSFSPAEDRTPVELPNRREQSFLSEAEGNSVTAPAAIDRVSAEEPASKLANTSRKPASISEEGPLGLPSSGGQIIGQLSSSNELSLETEGEKAIQQNVENGIPTKILIVRENGERVEVEIRPIYEEGKLLDIKILSENLPEEVLAKVKLHQIFKRFKVQEVNQILDTTTAQSQPST